MHRIFLGFSLTVLAVAVTLTGCNQSTPAPLVAQVKDEQIPPGESKPIPPGIDKPIPKTDPNDIPFVDPLDPDAPPVPEVKTDEDTLPLLPTLTALTGQEKYEAALSKAFLLVAEGKDTEALASMEEAQAVQETDFVKEEIERLSAKIAQTDAAQKTIDDIQEILTAGRPADAAKLAAEALEQYGETDAAETLVNLKRQADALESADLDVQVRKSRYVEEAEAARKASNLRSAVLSYDQATANGADVATLKETYEPLKTRLQKYDESRAEAARLSKDAYKLEDAVTVLKVAQQNWDTPAVRQEIAEAELAINNRKDRVAVADFEMINDIGIPRAGHAIAEELLGNFRPRFDVVERAQTTALLDELKLTHTALYEDETGRTEFGRLSRARFVVLGSVNRLSGITVNARLVDTQSGLIVQTARIAAATPAEMSNRLPALARMLQMSDDEKRSYEQAVSDQTRPVAPQAVPDDVPPPPPVPQIEAPAAAPAPIVVFTPRPPEFGRVVIQDFNGFRMIEIGAPAPQPVVLVDGPALINQRAFFTAVEVGDNCFRRGLFREALRHFEFAVGLNPGHVGVRVRLDQCRPLCPPPVVVVPILRPRLVVLPFVEFRDPFAIPSSIPPGLGVWTAEAMAPYFANRYDVVGMGEVYWWMGRLGMTLRDALTNPHARLCLGRAVNARFFLTGSLREVASFDVRTHILDSALNVQVAGATVRCHTADELRFRMGEIARLTTLPPQQQVVVVQQQQVVQQQVQQARIEIGNRKFGIAITLFKNILTTNPNHVEARQMLVQVEGRQRQADFEIQRQAAWQQQQAAVHAQRDRQIALAASAETQRVQAQQRALLFGAPQQKAIQGRQQLAQQNLIAQAQLAQRQNNLEQRVSLLESANAIQRDDAVVAQLAEAKAKLAVERQKRVAAEQDAREAQAKLQKNREIARVKEQLAAEQAKKAEAEAARREAVAAKNQAEYDTFVDQGQRALAKQNYGIAVASFQNARRLKPSPEIEKLVTAALTEQARADAMKKGDEERKKLEAQLAQEETRRKQLEDDNARLQVKYQAAIAKARAAVKERDYEEAEVSYKLAVNTLRTEEAAEGLREVTDMKAKARAASDADAKAKAAEQTKIAAVQKRLAAGRAALAAKQYDKGILELRAAAALKPDDVAVQTELTKAQQARDDAAALARRQKEAADKTAGLTKLMAAGKANMTAKNYDAAIVAFGDALKADPQNAEAKAGLAAAEAADAKMERDATAQAAAKAKRADYEKAMQTGQSALKLRQYNAALAAFKSAQTLLPGDAASTQAIADVTKIQESAAATNAAKMRAAELTQAVNAARVALRSSQFAEAQAAADKAAKISPDAPEVKKLAADIDAAKKAYAAAIQKKEMAAKKGAKVDAMLAEARTAIAAKDLTTASKHLAAAAVEDPTDPDIKKVQAEYEAVRRSMAAGAATAKKDQDAYLVALRNASTAFGAKQYPQAAAYAKQALALKPDDPAAGRILAEAQRIIDTPVPKKEVPVVPKKVEPKKEMPKVEPKKADPLPKVEPKVTPKKVEPMPMPKVEPKPVPKVNPMPKVEPKPVPKVNPMPKVEPKPAPKVDENAGKVAALFKAADEFEDQGKFVDAYRAYQEVLKLGPNPEAKKKSDFCAWVIGGQRDLAAGKTAEAAVGFENALKLYPGDANAKKLLGQARAKKKG